MRVVPFGVRRPVSTYFTETLPAQLVASLPSTAQIETELLLAKGNEVHGIVRRASTFNTDRIDHLYHDPHEVEVRMRLHYGDLSDGTGLRRILEEVRPDEVYNLDAQSHVMVVTVM